MKKKELSLITVFFIIFLIILLIAGIVYIVIKNIPIKKTTENFIDNSFLNLTYPPITGAVSFWGVENNKSGLNIFKNFFSNYYTKKKDKSSKSFHTTDFIPVPNYHLNKKEILNNIWDYQKPLLENSMHSNLKNGKNPYVLYNIQSFTNNLLKGASSNRDYKTLDELAELYLIAYDYLEEREEYVYFWPDIKGVSCKRNITVPLQTPSGKAKMWVYHNNSKYNEGYESFGPNVQFLYVISNAINIFSDISSDKRTNNMNELITKYSPVVIKDNYLRWIYEDNNVFQVKGWGCENYCNTSNYNHYNFIEKKLNKEFGHRLNYSYCNTYTDYDMWLFAGVIEILSANKKNPKMVSLSYEEKQKFLSYVKLSVELIKSRLSDSQLTDFNGNNVEGINFDLGGWDDHYVYAYTGYAGEDFPTKKDKKDKVGWDISHSRRFVHLFNSLYENKDITGENFPDNKIMTSLTNQIVYGTFNKDFEKPLFTNFMDGTNGWYRVGYHGGGFGYAPYDLSNSIMTGGYGFWSKYNPDMKKIMDSLWNYAQKKDISDPYLCYCYQDYERGCCNTKVFDINKSRDLLMFLPIFLESNFSALISPQDKAIFAHNISNTRSKSIKKDYYVPVNFKWDDVFGATFYTFAVNSSYGYNEINLTSTTRTGKYYGTGDFNWKVKSCNNLGCSEWSKSRVFTINSLESPDITFPLEKAVFIHNTQNTKGKYYVPVNFKWDDVFGATFYTFAVNSSYGYNEINLTSTTRTGKYYGTGDFNWKVKSCNNLGCSEWSKSRVFSVNHLFNNEKEKLKCSDGTLYNKCSSTKPKYCSNGNLINQCSSCGCVSGQQCQSEGGCKTEIKQGNNILLLHLDEKKANSVSGGKDVQDVSGDNHHGDEQGGVSFGANGKINTAVSFDGVNDYVNLDDDVLDGKNKLTIEAWIKPDEKTSDYMAIMSDYRAFYFMVGTKYSYKGKLMWRTWDSNGQLTQVILSDNPVIKWSEWQHVAITFDGNVVKLYHNGVVVGKSYAHSGKTLYDGKYKTAIGGRGTVNSWFFKGEIDEVSVYDYALSEGDIVSHYNKNRFL